MGRKKAFGSIAGRKKAFGLENTVPEQVFPSKLLNARFFENGLDKNPSII